MALEITIRVSANTLEHLGQQLESLGRQLVRGETPAGGVIESTSEALPDEPAAPLVPNEAELAKAASMVAVEKAGAFGKAKGGRALKRILKTFGVERAREIPPEKVDEFIEALNRAATAYKDVDKQPPESEEAEA